MSARLLALLAAGALAVTACGGGSGKAKSGGKGTTTTAEAPPAFPLTGLPDTGRTGASRPVLSVKIENTPESRPQAGIADADIVWEEVVEGGITRFLAMFHSAVPTTVGPIRSVRLTDPLIVWPEGGIFAYSGGADYATRAIRQAPVHLVDESGAGQAMFRDRSRRAPHNLFGRGEALFEKGGDPAPPPAMFTYRAAGAAVRSGVPASSFTIGFGRGYATTYTWDGAAGRWPRSTNGRAFLASGGTQVAPQNVVVLFVRYTGGVGAVGAEAQLVGEGDAWVFTGGQVVKGRWVRPDKTRAAELRDATGAPIPLAPGRTWVELPDVSYRVDVVSPPPASTAPTTAKRR